jgi:hypothetical protein
MSTKPQVFPNNKMKKKEKLQYRKPQLEVLGDLRTLTLGGSPGSGDSGGGKPGLPFFRPFPAGYPQPDGFPQPGGPPLP